MKKVLLLLLLLYSTSLISGTLKGKIINKETGEAIPNVSIIVEKDGVRCAKSHTDFWGKYSIKGLVPGTYKLYASYEGKEEEIVEGIVVVDGLFIYVDLELKEKSKKELPNEKEVSIKERYSTLKGNYRHFIEREMLVQAKRIPASKTIKSKRT